MRKIGCVGGDGDRPILVVTVKSRWASLENKWSYPYCSCRTHLLQFFQVLFTGLFLPLSRHYFLLLCLLAFWVYI